MRNPRREWKPPISGKSPDFARRCRQRGDIPGIDEKDQDDGQEQSRAAAPGVGEEVQVR